nr:hypothetical protein [Streptococcus equi]
MKRDDIIQFQIALPYSSEYYTDYMAEVKREVEAMRAVYQGALPAAIPMLPEKVTPDMIAAMSDSAQDFVIGLEREDVLFLLALPLKSQY